VHYLESVLLLWVSMDLVEVEYCEEGMTLLIGIYVECVVDLLGDEFCVCN